MLHSLFKLTCWTLVSIGFTAQLYNVLQQYLLYEAVTELHIQWPTLITYPDVAICMDLADIMPREQLSRMTAKDQFTASYLFKQTPPLRITSASIKVNNSYQWFSMRDSADWLLHFRFYQLFKYNKVCHVISFLDRKVTRSQIVDNELLRGMYLLTFDPQPFKSIPFMYYMMQSHNSTFAGRWHTFSYLTNPSFDSQWRDKIALSSNFFETRRLPYPYASDCLDYGQLGLRFGLGNRGFCRESCIKQRINRTDPGRVPFYIALHDTSRFANNSIVMQASYVGKKAKKYVSAVSECMSKCRRQDCRSRDNSGVHEMQYESPSGYGLYMRISGQPDIITELKPLFSVIELLTAIASCISFWYGISPLGLALHNACVDWCFGRRVVAPEIGANENNGNRLLVVEGIVSHLIVSDRRHRQKNLQLSQQVRQNRQVIREMHEALRTVISCSNL